MKEPNTVPQDRVSGYAAMARAITHQLERTEYYDPTGPDMFKETVTYGRHVGPSFIQLADAYLRINGPIKTHSHPRRPEVQVMADPNQRGRWQEFHRKHARVGHDLNEGHNAKYFEKDSDEWAHEIVTAPQDLSPWEPTETELDAFLASIDALEDHEDQ